MEKIKMFAYNSRDFDEKQYFDQFTDEFGIELKHVPFSPAPDNVELAAGCQCLNIITTPLTAEMLEKYYELGIRYIVTRTIGYDHIDLEACRRRGITVANTPYGPEGVAEFTLMLMLMTLRKTKSIESKPIRLFLVRIVLFSTMKHICRECMSQTFFQMMSRMNIFRICSISGTIQ